MRTVIIVLAAAALSACGLDTASTAATTAKLEQQQAEQGRATLDQTQRQIQQAMDRVQQRARAAEDQ